MCIININYYLNVILPKILCVQGLLLGVGAWGAGCTEGGMREVRSVWFSVWNG